MERTMGQAPDFDTADVEAYIRDNGGVTAGELRAWYTHGLTGDEYTRYSRKLTHILRSMGNRGVLVRRHPDGIGICSARDVLTYVPKGVVAVMNTAQGKAELDRLIMEAVGPRDRIPLHVITRRVSASLPVTMGQVKTAVKRLKARGQLVYTQAGGLYSREPYVRGTPDRLGEGYA